MPRTGITDIIIMDMMTATTTDARALLTLLTWFSPAFPVGAFAFSHGLEAAVAEEAIGTAEDVGDWVEHLLFAGSGWNDLVLLREALREDASGEVADLAEALAGSAERRAETLALGSAFAAAVRPWSGEVAGEPYPVAVAKAARAAELPILSVLLAFAHGFAASLVSAAVRLVPLGQSQAVALLRRLEPSIAEVARRAEGSTLEDLGSSALLSDISAMRHETLSTRLFRS